MRDQIFGLRRDNAELQRNNATLQQDNVLLTNQNEALQRSKEVLATQAAAAQQRNAELQGGEPQATEVSCPF